jgi:hypothetical protein
VDQLRAGVAARLMLMGIEGADSAALAGASRRLAQSLEASGAFETVANGDPSRQSREGELLFALRYTLRPGVQAQRFSVQGSCGRRKNSRFPSPLTADPAASSRSTWIPAHRHAAGRCGGAGARPRRVAKRRRQACAAGRADARAGL